MREKGFASRIVVQRSTEEETLHIVQFWRDSDIQPETNETGSNIKNGNAKASESFFTQVSRLSSWRRDNEQ